MANAPEGFIEQNTVADESVGDFRRIYDEIYSGAPRASAVIRANMGDGSTVWNRVTLMAVPKEDGLSDKAVGLVENVTREKQMELSLQHIAQGERPVEA